MKRTLKASAERVFDAWLAPDLVTHWMSAALNQLGLSGDVRRVESDACVGGQVHILGYA